VKHNIQVRAYHAENGRFADHGFKEEINNCNQFISYYSVGAHGQNGMVERYIGKVMVQARIILLHTKRFWLETIMHMLWLFAILETINLENTLAIDSEGCSLL